MATRVFAAVDLGASGGRVIAGTVDDDVGDTGQRMDLHVVHRFPNGVQLRDGHLRWDMSRLHEEILSGLGALVSAFPAVESIGIDTWAVDYGLLDERGRLLAEPVSYRDGRTAAVVDEVHRRVPPDELYRINGLQFLPFTTLYQLAAEHASGRLAEARHVVLLPDLVAYWLTGELGAEYTNATTTGLVDASTGRWSTELLARLGSVSAEQLPPIEQPGAERGLLRPDVAARLGLGAPIPVTTVGSHDTASAVAGLPAVGPHPVFVVCGTWSLVGVEADAPVLTEASRLSNFTNEGGVGGRIRLLRNVGGLWLLQESMRAWAEAGRPQALDELLAAAAGAPGQARIDVDDPAFIEPGDMPRRIAAAAYRRGGHTVRSPAEVARCVIDSLADGYARTIAQAARLSGRQPAAVHLVGGGSQNALLCQRTAEATGLTVIAGPVEATALGNLTTQARARGALGGDLDATRATLARWSDLRLFHPLR